MKQEEQYLLEIIKYILNGKNGELMIPPNDMDWRLLVETAKHHSLLYILYYGVECLPPQSKPDEKIYQYLNESAMYELVVSCNQIEAAKELFKAFEEAGIYTVAVKGICTKQHYPQPEMRSMGDIDILYKEEQQKKLRKVMRLLEYKEPVESRVHDAYAREPYINVEAHRKLVAADSKYSMYYEQIWEKLRERKEQKYTREMSLEDEYIYTIVHLVEHFQKGGIGIRFVMDVYVYNHMNDMNRKYLEIELKKLRLWEFYGNISRLAEFWFGSEKMQEGENEELLEKLSTYIVTNGTFGTMRNSAAVLIAKKGRNQFMWKAIFPDLRNMQSMFPWLKKWPILLPYSWVLRGVKSVLFRQNHIKTQIDRYRYGNKEYGKELKRFFETCGL